MQANIRRAHLAAIAAHNVLGDDDDSLIFLEAERQALGLPPVSDIQAGNRARNWVRKLHRYEDFAHRHGRTPRENTRNRSALPTPERHLGEWARYQRRHEERLTRSQRVRLDVSPAFTWDPHEAAWGASFDRCLRHVTSTGRLPTLTAADPVEFAAARWLSRQLRQLQAGTLPPERAHPVNRLLDWNRETPARRGGWNRRVFDNVWPNTRGAVAGDVASKPRLHPRFESMTSRRTRFSR